MKELSPCSGKTSYYLFNDLLEDTWTSSGRYCLPKGENHISITTPTFDTQPNFREIHILT